MEQIEDVAVAAPAISLAEFYGTRVEPPSPDRGKALIGMGAALLFPGAGHFLVGRFNRGAIWFLLEVGVILGAVFVYQNPQWLAAMLILLPVGLLIFLVQLIDAAWCAKHSSK